MGRESVQAQLYLRYLADMCIEIYAMNACVARASRAYSIGLPNFQHELALAMIQCDQSFRRVNSLCENIKLAHSGFGLDNTVVNVGEKVFKTKQHAAAHCTTRNY